jgi:probable phosphoglycerate mutase
MALLLLIRHAVTDATGSRLSGRTPGIHLSERGREQAKALAERLAAVPLATIHSSPLERCIETAEALTSGRTVGVTPDPGLLEVAYGRWTGRPLVQLARTKLWAKVQQSPSSARFPGGESLAEVQQRSIDALGAIATGHPRGIVAAVTHADVIRLALANYAGVHLDLFQRLVVSPASVSAVLLGDRIPRVVRMNDTGSLRDLVPGRRPGRRPPPRVRG